MHTSGRTITHTPPNGVHASLSGRVWEVAQGQGPMKPSDDEIVAEDDGLSLSSIYSAALYQMGLMGDDGEPISEAVAADVVEVLPLQREESLPAIAEEEPAVAPATEGLVVPRAGVARPQFIGWAEPGAPGPTEKLFVSYAQPSWASPFDQMRTANKVQYWESRLESPKAAAVEADAPAPTSPSVDSAPLHRSFPSDASLQEMPLYKTIEEPDKSFATPNGPWMPSSAKGRLPPLPEEHQSPEPLTAVDSSYNAGLWFGTLFPTNPFESLVTCYGFGRKVLQRGTLDE